MDERVTVYGTRAFFLIFISCWYTPSLTVMRSPGGTLAYCRGVSNAGAGELYWLTPSLWSRSSFVSVKRVSGGLIHHAARLISRSRGIPAPGVSRLRVLDVVGICSPRGSTVLILTLLLQLFKASRFIRLARSSFVLAQPDSLGNAWVTEAKIRARWTAGKVRGSHCLKENYGRSAFIQASSIRVDIADVVTE